MSTAIDKVEADRFLRALGGSITFQTFDDSKRKDPRLSRVLHGTISNRAGTLASLNACGAGVFVMVNEGDGKGRKAGSVERIRAYFADFDGVQPPDVATQPLRPHCVVESSPGRWHWYWWIEGAPLGTFKGVQHALAERFNSDPTICDLPRVMRLPGFMHCKGEPFRTRIVELRDAPRYSLAEFVQAFGIDLVTLAEPITSTLEHSRSSATVTRLPTVQRHKRTLPPVIPEGERNSTLLSLAGGLVRKGHNLQAVTDRLQRINAERCSPPLCATEVDDIATRAAAYGSGGFIILPHALLDSPEWGMLTPRAHDVIVTAFRRNDGTTGGIALTWGDFDGLPGFAKKDTFYAARNAVVEAGILQRVSEGGNTQTGRKPDLFRIAPQWLRNSASPEKVTLRQSRKSTPLHR